MGKLTTYLVNGVIETAFFGEGAACVSLLISDTPLT